MRLTLTTTAVLAACCLSLLVRPAHADDVAFTFAAGASPGLFLNTAAASLLQDHPLSPEALAAVDLDGNGRDDLIADFGAAYGVWVHMNQQSWFQLHPLSPSAIVTGDLDGNGIGDVVLAFPGYGLWSWNNNSSWQQLTTLDPGPMATGNVNGFVGDEVVASFSGIGVWIFGSGAWRQLHPFEVTHVVIANTDEDGRKDVLLNFAGYGLWVYRNDASFAQLHPFNPEWIAAGDRDASGIAEVLCDFGSTYGLWMLANGTSWSQTHPLSADRALFVDRTGNGRDEVLIDFGAPYGVWQLADGGPWTQFQTQSVATLVRGRLQGGGTVTFTGVGLFTNPFSQPFTEAGITVTPASGSWIINGYGAPAPAIIFRGPLYQQPSMSASVNVSMGGQAFQFVSVGLYSSVTAIPYVFAGYRGNTLVFTTSATQPGTLGTFVAVGNPNAAQWIDRLVITLTQPMNTSCPTCGGSDGARQHRPSLTRRQ